MIQKLLQLHRNILPVLGGIFLIITITFSGLRAQAVIGARELSVGQATTALRDTDWSMFGNPALMQKDEASVSFFGVRYFGLSEITDMAASFTYPTPAGVFGAAAHRYGFNLFNENRMRVGYKNAFRGFHYGVVLNYSHVTQGGGYGSAGALGLDLGIAAPVIPDLWIGAKATNINQPEYGSRNNEKLARELSIGFSYRLSDIALFTADMVKDIQFPISYRSGVEIKIIDELSGRAGITTKPQTFSAGFGYRGAFWSANVAVQRHENSILGYSPAMDFKISW